MVSAAEFKKHISKFLGKYLRTHGFKGSGCHYRQENEDFYFAVGLQGSLSGNKCYVEFGIHPKFFEPEHIDPGNFKYYNCELRTRIGSDWKYSESERRNLITAEQIAIEVIKYFKAVSGILSDNPKIFEKITFSTGESISKQFIELLNGLVPSPTEARLTWVLFEYWRKTNQEKAIEVAQFGIKELKPGNPFFARNEYLNYLNGKNRL